MKTCFKCGALKALGDFYAHAKMADGHLNKCKSCTKADTRAYTLENSERMKAWRLKSARSPSAVEKKAAWHAKNPEARRAHAMVHKAVNRGALLRLPCEICGASDVEAHHPHYGAPLLVTWLCKHHHNEVHAT